MTWLDGSSRKRAMAFCALLAASSGCGGPAIDPPTGDAGAGDTGTLADAGGALPVDGGASDAGDPCLSASASIGPAGGTLDLCGARLTVAPGALTASVEVRIEREDLEGPGAPYEVIGSVYRLSPTAFPGVASLALPHEDHALEAELVRHDGEAWVAHGACSDDGTHLIQALDDLGTFALVRDARELPASPAGRGGVKLELTLDGTTFQLASRTTGHAGLSTRIDGTEVLVLQGLDAEGRMLFVTVEIDALGEVRVTDVSFSDLGNASYVWILDYEGTVPMSGTLRPEARHLIGVLEGKLVDESSVDHDMRLTIDAVPQPFVELPVRSCD